MSSYGAGRDGEAQPDGNDDTLDETQSTENTSIIGKVKSRVSSIIPNRISKWFSPSQQGTGDSINGSPNGSLDGISRRRRRLDLEDDDDDVEQKSTQNADDEDDDEEGEDNSDDEDEDIQGFPTAAAPLATTRRSISTFNSQPPSKRSRLNIENTYMLDNSFLPRTPLVASTPAVGNNLRSSISHPLNPVRDNRFLHMNLYGSQSEREPAYDFKMSAHKIPNFESSSNINNNNNNNNNNKSIVSNIVPLKTSDNVQSDAFNSIEISSRRSLNIPSTSKSSNSITKLKIKPLSSVKVDMPSTSSNSVRDQQPMRTSTTIFENDGVANNDEIEETTHIDEADNYPSIVKSVDPLKCNGRSLTGVSGLPIGKRQKLMNGIIDNVNDCTTNVVGQEDSVSESSDVDRTDRAQSVNRRETMQRKTGLFNISASNSRNGSRTSSFGNGLNFFTHLEGRKSLFAGTQATTNEKNNPLGNSTLSLTSLNRRQFNASIYGSTSALSDSRLLNTYSPFYKGKTTYGGAAAYNKCSLYSGAGNGAGANAVRITPTLIRPTSSLSTLSSSNNSLTTAGANVIGEPTSAISSTAKRILDLINEFSTPLSEAKKMANNLKMSQHPHLPQAKPRLSEADLQASRAMRLSHVRSPYTRPSGTVQSPHVNVNGKANLLPPTRELQVPSMSQLLQMKKLQNTTERSRQITTQNSQSTTRAGVTTEYTLPMEEADSGNALQQKHTNKMRHKVNSSGRPSKDTLNDDAPPPPVNLPNIAFPLMQSVPKFDIPLPKPTSSVSASAALKNPNTNKDINPPFTFGINNNKNFQSPATSTTTNTTNITVPPAVPTPRKSISRSPTIEETEPKNMFVFSKPLEIDSIGVSSEDLPPFNGTFKFSLPAEVPQFESTSKSSSNQSPVSFKFDKNPAEPLPLKTGSVLDALKTPFMTSTASTTVTAPSTTTNNSSIFGIQFKKSDNEWECQTCLIRNKQDASKCVACETPRTPPTIGFGAVTNTTKSQPLSTTSSSSFGSQFKMSSNEWECDACMLRNKQDASKCVACETPRKGATASALPTESKASTTTAASMSLPSIQNTFGDAFKPKGNNWECPTCLISNKSESSACVACETKKPGAASSAASSTSSIAPAISTFKFGFAAAKTEANSDSGFKSLAAEQKASKWECEACMTRNDESRQKCVCCDQAKPGTQSSSENAPKFSFGASTASKFSFGFGAAANAPKEDELRKATGEAIANKDGNALSTPTQKTETKGFLFAPKSTGQPFGGTSGSTFMFGTKAAPTIGEEASKEKSKDEADTKTSSTPTPMFQFGTPSSTNSATSASNSAPTTSTVASTTFKFGAPVSITTSANAAATTTKSLSPSVKFSLASTTATNDTAGTESAKATTTAPIFSFGAPISTATSSTSLSGFSFSKPAAATTSPATTEANKTKSEQSIATAAGGFTFKTPAPIAATSSSTSFNFGGTSTPSATTTTATTEAGTGTKPMFLFGSASTVPAESTSASASSSATSTTTSAIASTSSNPLTVTSTSFAFKPLFGSASVSSTASTSSTTSITSTPATTMSASSTTSTFGGFGNSAVGTTSAPSFGGSFKSSPLGAASSSFPSTFGGFAAPSSSASANKNIFGSFGSAQSSDPKPAAATATVFGNVKGTAAPSSSGSGTGTNAFVFGSSTPVTNKPSNSTETVTSSTNNTTWPKEGLLFGGSTAGTGASAISSTTSDTSKSLFSGFGAAQPSASNSASSTSGTPVFGNLAASASTGNVGFGAMSAFGSNTATVNPNNALSSATNIFGSAQSGNTATPSPAFGGSAFGSTTSLNTTPAFGNTPAAPIFAGFGAIAASNSTDGASAAKKSEPAFNFGANANATQSASGTFNFGSGAGSAATSKPAFNFSATNQPAFNFTGSTEQAQTTRPFQFGATTAAPIFNFGGAAAAQEGTAGAPFQFSASATPASTNIFAPSPTPGAQSAQQVRRKIRAPIRRLPPR